MRKFPILLLFLASLLCFPAADAQTYATITGSNTTDGSGAPIASGKLCFAPTDNNGNPIGIRGAGQIVNKAECVPIVNGAIAPASGSFQLLDTRYATPANFCWKASLVTPNGTLPVAGYSCVQMSATWCTTASGATICNFDEVVPNSPAQAAVAAPAISVLGTNTLAPGSTASVGVTSNGAANYALTFNIPQGQAGVPGATGQTGPTGAPGGVANISTSTPGLPCVYTSTTGCGGIDPLLGRDGNGVAPSSVPPLDAVESIPIQTGTMPMTGNGGLDFLGNSIPAGVGSNFCSAGTNTATGDCFVDQLAIAMGEATNKNNLAVGGDYMSDSAIHAANGINHSYTDKRITGMLNNLNDADNKTRGGFEQQSSAAAMAAILQTISVAGSNKIRGNDIALPAGYTLDTTLANFNCLTATTTGQTATFTWSYTNLGNNTPSAAYILLRTLDQTSATSPFWSGNVPGSIGVTFNANPTVYFNNFVPIPFGGNSTTNGFVAYRIGGQGIPGQLLNGTNTVTVTSFLTGSQNWANVCGVVWTPQPFGISSYSIANGVPTFTSSTTMPAMNQRISAMHFGTATGQLFNGQVLQVTSVSGSTFTTTAPPGLPQTQSLTTELFSEMWPYDPAMWVAGTSRNLMASQINARDVDSYNNDTEDLVAGLQADGWMSQLNYVALQTSWLNNVNSMQAGWDAHHPDTPTGEQQILAAFKAPTYRPSVRTVGRFAKRNIQRTITSATLGGCYFSMTDDYIYLFSGVPLTCYPPSQAETALSNINNETGPITIVNGGAATITLQANPGQIIVNNPSQGIPPGQGGILIPMSNPTSYTGRWYFISGIPPSPTCSISAGSAVTITAGQTCYFNNVATAYTWPTSGLIAGQVYTFQSGSGNVADQTFTNDITSVLIHPDCTLYVLAVSSTGVQPQGQFCEGSPWLEPSIITTPGTTLTNVVKRYESTITGSTTLTLPTTWSAGAEVMIHMRGAGYMLFSGATSGSASTAGATVLGGETAILRSVGSGGWDIIPISPAEVTTGSIGGSSIANGTCTSGTATLQGVTNSMRIAVTAQTYAGDGFSAPFGYVSGTNTITVKVCNYSGAAGAPAASLYNVAVTP